LSSARVGYLASVGFDLQPHVVPITFALADDRLVTAVDQKPKSTTSLRRLRNIVENPRVAVLCDEYAEDWARLWWVRVDGRASILEDGAARDIAVDQLVAKYPQYRVDPPLGAAVVIAIDSWSGWAF
jgi:PPOX class probable F420-dependent enzyme